MPVEAMPATSDDGFALEIEPPKTVVLQQECALVRLAVARNPSSVPFRFRLARLLFDMDGFDEAIAVLEGLIAEADEFRFFNLLGLTLLARENEPDTRRAEALARHAAAIAPTPQQRASALATLGKAQVRLGNLEAARASLLDAVRDEPRHRDAYKRLVSLELSQGRAEVALDLSSRMLEEGVDHSLVLMSRALALVRLGRIEEARSAFGLDAFLRCSTPAPPPGWPDIAVFNAGLAEELRAHPALRLNRYGLASVDTWRVDQPATPGSSFMLALQGMIAGEVAAFVRTLSGVDHPWARARPGRAVLHNWCVMAGAEGHETWHIHQNGWLSGTYYVDVPETVVSGSDRRGCIVFGVPEGRVGPRAAADYGEIDIRPRAGLLTLFPSHAFHRTFPHGSESCRICVAFDVFPASSA